MVPSISRAWQSFTQKDSHGNNKILLALGIRGYAFQSQTLHIPDRWGFFAPGPPQSQAAEAAVFATLVVANCQIVLCEAVIVYIQVFRVQRPVLGAMLFIELLRLGTMVLIWAGIVARRGSKLKMR